MYPGGGAFVRRPTESVENYYAPVIVTGHYEERMQLPWDAIVG